MDLDCFINSLYDCMGDLVKLVILPLCFLKLPPIRVTLGLSSLHFLFFLFYFIFFVFEQMEEEEVDELKL